MVVSPPYMYVGKFYVWPVRPGYQLPQFHLYMYCMYSIEW